MVEVMGVNKNLDECNGQVKNLKSDKILLRNAITKDLERYTGSDSLIFDRLKVTLFTMGYIYTKRIRLCQYYNNKKGIFYKFLFYQSLYRHYRLGQKFSMQISWNTSIGAGLKLYHCIGIVIHGETKIGDNCSISHGVTIGNKQRGQKKGVPKIGSNCYIGPGAIIFGNIIIGDNCSIGSNAVVLNDVPSNGVVVGNPAHIVSYAGSEELHE